MLHGPFVYLNLFFLPMWNLNFVVIEFPNNRETSVRIPGYVNMWVPTFTHRGRFAVVDQSVVLIGLPQGS